MTGRQRLALSVCWILVINVFACWIFWQAAISSGDQSDLLTLRGNLARWTVVSQSLGWIVMLCAGALSFRAMRGVVASLTKKARRSLVLLAAGSLLAVWLIPPRTNRIYFDEHIYENIAQSVAVNGEAWLCNEGEAEYGNFRAFGKEYNKQPNGHPFYLSVFFRLFGISEFSAHLADNFALLIGVVAVFFAAFLLFSSETAAIFSGLLYLLTPQNLIWSATVAVEPAAAAFSALAVAAAALYVREPMGSTAALWGSVTGLSLYYRPESICIVAPVLLIVLLFRWREITEPRFYAALAVLAGLAGVEFLHLYAVRNEGWGTTGDRFSWAAYEGNIAVNVPYLYLNARYPVFFTTLSAIGLVSLSRWRGLLPMLIWFLYSFGIFLFFYAGSFDYGADIRFSMISAAPLSIFGGVGAATLLSILEARSQGFGINAALKPFLFAAVLLSWVPFLPLIRTVGSEAADARVDIDAIRDFAARLPNESVVLSHTPSVWLMLGRNSIQTSNVTYNKGHIDNDLFNRYRGGVFFHFGAWCNYDNPLQQGFCNKVFESYFTKSIGEYYFGDKHYTVYQLMKHPEPGYDPPRPAAEPPEAGGPSAPADAKKN